MNQPVLQPTEPKAVLFLLLFVVWWFIRQQPADDAAADEDGGVAAEPVTGGHPHRPRPSGGRGPRWPRRGPHGDPAPSPPRRVRGVRARARTWRGHSRHSG